MKSEQQKNNNIDPETIRLFLVLGLLTIALVLGLRWTLFAPPSAEITGVTQSQKP